MQRVVMCRANVEYGESFSADEYKESLMGCEGTRGGLNVER